NRQLAGLRADAAELERLRKEVDELHRLRAEVARLRRDSADQQRFPSQGPGAPKPEQQGAQDKPSDYTQSDVWSDAGTSTPEAAMETLLWVLRTGDENRLKEMIQWQVTGDPGGPYVNLEAEGSRS